MQRKNLRCKIDATQTDLYGCFCDANATETICVAFVTQICYIVGVIPEGGAAL